MLNQNDLICRIDSFLNATGISPATFGRKALGDPNFVFDLKKKKKPRSPSLNTASKIEKFIAEYETKNGAG